MSGLGSIWLNGDGCLMLRRWSGTNYPRPQAATVVGYEQRPATEVGSGGSATFSNSTVYWFCVDKVSANGILTQAPQSEARVAVWGPGGYKGEIPNTPSHLRVQQIAGPKLRLTWFYNPLDQQVAPQRFDVFSDSGTGTMDWLNPVANVSYVEGRDRYVWTSGVLSDGTTYVYNVLARSATGIYSLIPDLRDWYAGHHGIETPVGALGLRRTISTTAPADPPAPAFV